MNATQIRMWAIENGRLVGEVRRWLNLGGGRQMAHGWKTIVTTPIAKEDGNIITTEGGTRYELVGPSRMTLRVQAQQPKKKVDSLD